MRMQKVRIKTREELISFLNELGRSFSFHTETTTQGIRDFRARHGSSKAIPDDIANQALNYYYLEMESISFCDGNKACVVHDTDVSIKEIIEAVSPILLNAINIIGHNVAFDIKVMHKYGIILDDKRIYCTMVADHLLDEERDHGLKSLAKNILGQQDTMSYKEARALGGQAFDDYCLNDVIWTWQLCMWQQSRLREQGLDKLFREIEMPFQFCIVDMEVNGFEIDLVKAKETTRVLLEAREKFTIEMLDYLGEQFQIQQTLDGNTNIISPINFESPAQLAVICEKRLGLKKVEETDGGAYSVGKVFLEYYSDNEFVQILNKYKIASQLYKLFFKPLPSLVCGDGKVRAHFKDTGTKTGRLSCSSPNLQQLAKPNKKFPIETRACFIAGKGRKLITADFSGQEVCIMVEESKDDNIKDILLKNQDVHLKTAKDAFGANIPEEALSRDHPEYNTYVKKFKEERAKAKIFNFALPYGKGAFGFSKDYGITEAEAQKILDNYFTKNFKLKLAMDSARQEVERTGTVTYLSGRKRHFRKIKNGDWEGYPQKVMRQAFNAKIQGFGGDMMRIAMNNIRAASKRHPHLDIKLHATIHDEVVASCKEEHVVEASALIKICMETSVKLIVPLLSEIGVGDDYSQAK